MVRIFSFFILLFVLPSSIFAKVSTMEKNALLDIYNCTNGRAWTITWDLSSPVYSWYGVGIKEDKIVSLELFDNHLTGILPSSLGDLKYLKTLNLAFNNIGGNIPESIVLLRRLTVLRLGRNKLSGEIPENIGNMILLERFELGGNELEGKIPKTLAKIYTLKALDLSGNRLTGEIPWRITTLPNLDLLQIQDNNLDKSQISHLRNKNINMAVFEYDGNLDKTIHTDIERFIIKTDTRMVDVGFEDAND